MASGITLESVYERACGPEIAPYPFQHVLAREPDIDVLVAPTGLGKTAAVTLGWAWRRLTRHPATPRRLIWCLPMRALVEQTAHEARIWMQRLGELFRDHRQGLPGVHVLMGGAVDQDWRMSPEDPAIIIGTQDMLLSRALMRGYGMGRFGWPVDYGLLHSDALWVFDEVQLMGAGLSTSAQLEAFRRCSNWRRDGLARSLWVSATLDPRWLNTAEFRREVPKPKVLRWNDVDAPEPSGLSDRLDAVKLLSQAKSAVTAEAIKKPEAYARSLAREAMAAHRRDTTTLVILNSVHRAQAVYRALGELAEAPTVRLLIHSRYRPPDRRMHESRLRAGEKEDRIVVATQAVEAGVDMTSATLFAELAPWSSMVQRFGRCNRKGELNTSGGAQVRWIDVETEGDSAPARPYEAEELKAARAVLAELHEVSPRNLPPPSRPAMPIQVIRQKDFEELFDTDADLSGYDLDISPYIRDGEDVSVSLFWRSIGNSERVAAEPPRRDELCPAPLSGDVQAWLKPKNGTTAVYVDDPLRPGSGSHWIRLDKSGRRLRPGLTLLLDVEMGGYDCKLGFVGASGKAPVQPVAEPESAGRWAGGDDTTLGVATEDDSLASGLVPVPLGNHLDDVAAHARCIAEAVDLPAAEASALVRAATWHDLGKAYSPFQTLLGCGPAGPLLAKSGDRNAPCTRRERRKQAEAQGLRRYFRHELASTLAFLQQHEGEPDADLVAFLVAAHHGRVRMGLRALPEERPSSPERRIARGVQDGDPLPEVRCGTETSAALTLDLGLMEMGEDTRGRPSWSARTQDLLAAYGPFRLAYLEALIRIADWRASETPRKEPLRDD